MGTGAIPPPIIVVRRKKGHGGHHGGAWKVAYADFVTAMMALFIVLWLLSSDDKVKKAVGGYFQDPTGTGKMAGSNMAGAGLGLEMTSENMSKLKEKIDAALKELPKFEQMKNNVQVTVTNEGLRIELLEKESGMFFESGNAKPSPQGTELIRMLATQLSSLPNKLLIEGHTDAKPYASEAGYTNWELSADRANCARRILQESGIQSNRVGQVRGFADQQLRLPAEPFDPSNRRVSVLVQYREIPQNHADPHPPPKAAAPPH
ncbi:flagellar motor protein MotB [uncultured Paludibaculum sp.]|uniref:flagellar motor protein MotB n=1 Tax=uncultured Paludibaculum sp. TaxID=1765020 RepID=UPI002AAAA68A|nr:flagellar motor protein MotB [uncultured Paludibaculum sp.]